MKSLKTILYIKKIKNLKKNSKSLYRLTTHIVCRKIFEQKKGETQPKIF